MTADTKISINSIPAAFRKFLEDNRISCDEYHDQLMANVPRFIRLNPFAAIDLSQLAALLSCTIVPTILPDFFALPGRIKISDIEAYRCGQFYGIDLASGR